MQMRHKPANLTVIRERSYENYISIATGTDQEEGTAVMYPIDNGITVTSSLAGSVLTWKLSGGSGDASTLAGYRLLARDSTVTSGNDTAVFTGASIASGLDLSTLGLNAGTPYQITVVAVGKPCIRNAASVPLPYTPTGGGGIPVTFDIPGYGSFAGLFTRAA
jgi:hypothetical protein